MLTYPQLRILNREQKEGLGEAYKAGMRLVLADPSIEKIIMMDADGSHDVQYLVPMLKESEYHNLIVNSRYVRGGGIENWSGWRYALSQGGNLYARSITGLPVHDLTAGYMCFQSSLLRKIDLERIHASGYAFQIELKFHALHTHQATYKELPIIFKARREGESKISRHIVREGLVTPWRLLPERFVRH